jgi:AcrR family transcriptional regulator
MAKKTSTRQLILEAAVTCIEKYGLEAATTRRIAIEAGTNVASINYHFRSKEHLLGEVLLMTIRHMLQDVFAAIDDTDQAFSVLLPNVLFYLLDGGLHFPGITQAHLQRAMDDRAHQSISARAMSRVFEGLSARAISAYPRQDADLLRLRMSQLMSSVMFTMLRPDFFRVASRHRLTSSSHARALANDYSQLFLRTI